MVYTPVSAAANLRRSSILGAVLGAIAVAVTSLQGHPLMGLFFLVGIALGAGNNRILQLSVISYATAVNAGTGTKRKFRGSVALRLGAITVLSLGVALLVRPDGLGIFVGLAVFQVLMLVGAAVPVFRSIRPHA